MTRERIFKFLHILIGFLRMKNVDNLSITVCWKNLFCILKHVLDIKECLAYFRMYSIIDHKKLHR